jgi:menaquinone-dependent protoporphyrinogen oxidase
MNLSGVDAGSLLQVDRAMKILIVYGTHYGQTRAISERIAERLRAAGHEVELRNARENIGRESFERADALIIGASVEGGKHSREVVGLVRAFHKQLVHKVSAFFSVCLARAENTPKGRKAVKDYVETFIRESRWTPAQVGTFAGALMYRRYGFFVRTIMRALAWRVGLAIDTSKNHELTDWRAVEAFADTFASRLTVVQQPLAALSVSQTRAHTAVTGR